MKDGTGDVNAPPLSAELTSASKAAAAPVGHPVQTDAFEMPSRYRTAPHGFQVVLHKLSVRTSSETHADICLMAFMFSSVFLPFT
ncbi:MAG: hypothetical protein ACLT3Y_07360 [Ruminococcus callidus]